MIVHVYVFTWYLYDFNDLISNNIIFGYIFNLHLDSWNVGGKSKKYGGKSEENLGFAEPAFHMPGTCLTQTQTCKNTIFFTQTWFDPKIVYPKKCVNYNKYNLRQNSVLWLQRKRKY